jgi:PAS domain S-box-containing protein
MPGMDGYEVCRRLKADPVLEDIPVIFISALAETEDKLKAFQMGGVDYITKPFQPEEVSARINTHLKLKKYRRLIEQKADASEKRFKVIFEQVNEAIFVHDLMGRLYFVNSKACNNLGYKEDELIKMTVSDVDPDFVARVDGGKFWTTLPVSFESRHQRKNGSLFPVEVRLSSIVFNEQPFVLALVSDITERKQAEADLRAALEEAHQRQKEVTALLSASKRIPLSKTFDEAARQIFDICKDLIGAKSGYVALLSEDGKENEVLFLEAGGLPCDVDPELPMPIRGLREVAYRTNDTAYDNAFADGRWMKYMPVGHVALENVLFAPLIIGKQAVGLMGLANKPGGFTDRDAKIAKAFGDLAAVALIYAEYQDQLRESEERLQIIFNNAPAIMLLVNENTEVIKMNQTGLIAAGKPMDKVIGLRGGDILNCVGSMQNPRGCGFGEDCKQCKLRKTVEDTFATDQNFYKIEAGLWLKKQDKTIEHTVLISTSIVDSKTPKTVLVTIDDITERKQLEKRIQQVQKMEAIGNLAGGIAHDFNNILFPIIGYSEMMIDGLPPDSPEQQKAMGILTAGKRGSDLVKQILAFSRQSESKIIPIKIQSILKEVLKLCRSTIPSDIEISDDIQHDCGPVQADPTQIHQVAMNLITNAYHAVEPKSGNIFILLKEIILQSDDTISNFLKPGKYAELTVSDTGNGIDPSIINKIFEPYFTTKEKGKGTGLGLATVYGIVREHDGDIKVYSKLGKGAKFDVYLPIIEKGSNDQKAKMQEVDPTGTESILLVDDDELIAELEREMLKHLGYQVTAHINSFDALMDFKANPDVYDLVLTDMTMPKMTGVELAQKLMSIKPNIPVIICTGFSKRINKKKATEIGIKGFLMKPVRKLEMSQMVRKVLDEAKNST